MCLEVLTQILYKLLIGVKGTRPLDPNKGIVKNLQLLANHRRGGACPSRLLPVL